MRGGRAVTVCDPAALPALRLFWQARTPQRPSTHKGACCALTSSCKCCWPPHIGLSLFALKAAKLLAALPTGTSLRYILSSFSACYGARRCSQGHSPIALDNAAPVLRLPYSISSTKSLRDRGACFWRIAKPIFASRFVKLGVCCWSR